MFTDNEQYDWLDDEEDGEFEDLILMVYSQIMNYITKRNIEPILNWLETLDTDALLHFLPQNNPMFHGTRPELSWFGSVEYKIDINNVFDTIGEN